MLFLSSACSFRELYACCADGFPDQLPHMQTSQNRTLKGAYDRAMEEIKEQVR